MPFEFLQHVVFMWEGNKTLEKHHTNPAGSSHNLYTVYSGGNHKIIAPHNASSDPWNDERIRATLWPERQQEIIESILEALIFAGFGAMIVLAYLT